MVKRIATARDHQWYQRFQERFYSKQNFLMLAKHYCQNHSSLSQDHIYVLITNIVSILISAFHPLVITSEESKVNRLTVLTNTIRRKLDEQELKELPESIRSLHYYAQGRKEFIEWQLFKAKDPNGEKLEPVTNPADYAEVSKEITRELADKIFSYVKNTLSSEVKYGIEKREVSIEAPEEEQQSMVQKVGGKRVQFNDNSTIHTWTERLEQEKENSPSKENTGS